MGLPDRLYNIAKSHLDKAVDRWQEIDGRAQQEIDAFMASHTDSNGQSALDRALNKINTTRADNELQASSNVSPTSSGVAESNLAEIEAKVAAERAINDEIGPRPTLSGPAAQARTQTLVGAYKMLGLEPGADWLTVQAAYRKLRERAAPERFPDGSPEQSTARDIQRRIDAAHMMLAEVLAPKSDRFDRLEL